MMGNRKFNMHRIHLDHIFFIVVTGREFRVVFKHGRLIVLQPNTMQMLNDVLLKPNHAKLQKKLLEILKVQNNCH